MTLRLNSDWTRKVNEERQHYRDTVKRKSYIPKSLYTQYATRKQVHSSRDYRRKIRKEQNFWVLGGVLWGIAAIGGIAAIIWAATS